MPCYAMLCYVMLGYQGTGDEACNSVLRIRGYILGSGSRE